MALPIEVAIAIRAYLPILKVLVSTADPKDENALKISGILLTLNGRESHLTTLTIDGKILNSILLSRLDLIDTYLETYIKELTDAP